MPVRVTPDQATSKWVSRLSGATTEIQQGVSRVTQAPGQAAAAKFQKWQQAIQESANKWRRNVAAVSLEQWQASMVNIGVPRVAQGAQAKQDKFQRFASEFFPHLERGVEAVSRMPDTTFEDRVQRAVAMMRHNRNFQRGGGGGAGMPPGA